MSDQSPTCAFCVEQARTLCHEQHHLTICVSCGACYSPASEVCCTSCGRMIETDPLWADNGMDWLAQWDGGDVSMGGMNSYSHGMQGTEAAKERGAAQQEFKSSEYRSREALLTEEDLMDVENATLELLVRLYGPNKEKAQVGSDSDSDVEMELDFGGPECLLMDLDFEMTC
ncbi:hypothetical protein BDW59DRAFT_166344 [Aspergillus cavernicola]|uniref:RING-type domain-containing protein n=1 Tax=Aspergillus cavernicola TaxID=176166 RepID=A0ABR4HM02_9EURO